MADDSADIKARALKMNVQGEIWQYGLVRDRGQDAMNNKMPAIPFFEALPYGIDAIEADFNTFRDYTREHASELDPAWVAGSIGMLSREIEGLKATVNIPQLTVDEEASEELTGVVESVDDGDTIIIDGREIRLAGIDAPEKGTERGQEAKRFLENMVLGKTVTVKIDKCQGIEFYGRVLGVVFTQDGTNVNLELVANCMAEVNTKYGRHNFIDPEELKKAAEACSETWPHEGIVKVYSSKTNSEIWVDGADTGKVTPAEISVPVGRHTFMCVTVGAAPDSKVMDVKPGKVEVRLFPFAMPVTTGLVEVESYPAGAEFVIDDVPMGRTPTTVEVVADGPHTIAFYLDGYEPEVDTVVARAGQRVTVKATLEKE